MKQHREILKLIAAIRESHSQMVNIYTQGSCLNFYLVLRAVYPEAVAYYNIDHVITKIGARFYDITGEVHGIGYGPLVNYYSKSGMTRAYRQMLRAEFPLTEK